MANYRKISGRQEKRVAAELGGKTQANSGATRLGGGGDVRVPGDTRVECKYTTKDRYVLKSSDLKKLREQAIRGGLEEPVFQIAFRDRLGNMHERFAVTPISRSSMNLREPICVEKKSITIYLANLRYWTSNSHSIYLTFEGGEYYEIRLWSDYLAEREARCSKSTPSNNS
jgi:hypothetical protein